MTPSSFKRSLPGSRIQSLRFHAPLPFVLSPSFFLSFLLLFFLPSIRCGDLPYLMGGTVPNIANVVVNGAFAPNTSFLQYGYPTSQPFGDLYLWLSEDTPSAIQSIDVTIAVNPPRSGEGYFYLPFLNYTATTLNAPTLTVYRLSNRLVDPATFSSVTGLCDVEVSRANAFSRIVLQISNSTGSYDDVKIDFNHGCFYPSVSIASDDSQDDDILAGQVPPVQNGSPPRLNATIQSAKQEDIRLIYLMVMADEEAGWPAGSTAPFTLSSSGSNAQLSVEPDYTLANEQMGYLTVSGEATSDFVQLPLQLTFQCIDGADSGSVELDINFLFSLIIRLSFQVTCGPGLAVNAWQDLTITTPSIPGAAVTPLYTRGHVQSVPQLPAQLTSLALVFSYPATNRYQLQLAIATTSQSLSRPITSTGGTLPPNTTIGVLPTVSSLSPHPRLTILPHAPRSDAPLTSPSPVSVSSEWDVLGLRVRSL